MRIRLAASEASWFSGILAQNLLNIWATVSVQELSKSAVAELGDRLATIDMDRNVVTSPFTNSSKGLGLPRVPGYPSGTRVINYPGNFRATVCTTVRPMLSDRCPVYPVYDVGVLWPNGWTEQDETWHAGRPRP